MNSSTFSQIIDRVKAGKPADLSITIGEKNYTRRFNANSRLIILGGGHVGLALCKIASMLDFDIIVADDRPAFANRERFPEATRVICDSFENAIRSIDINPSDYVCILTRGHRWDQLCVETILSGTMPHYLGMIGSRRRVAGLKECLSEKGFSNDRIDQLHAPIGLSIGAQTPMEIALSICAEMIQIKRENSEKPADHTLFAKNTDRELLDFISSGNTPRALLMVLSSDGSTPVESGAMMAVDPLGNSYGTIGGGCSEAAAVQKARRIIGTGDRAVIDFDMTNEVAEENRMVCGGTMTVLIEDIQS